MKKLILVALVFFVTGCAGQKSATFVPGPDMAIMEKKTYARQMYEASNNIKLSDIKTKEETLTVGQKKTWDIAKRTTSLLFSRAERAKSRGISSDSAKVEIMKCYVTAFPDGTPTHAEKWVAEAVDAVYEGYAFADIEPIFFMTGAYMMEVDREHMKY
jgi:hypothetical protein